MKFNEKYLRSLKKSSDRVEVKEDSGLIFRVSPGGAKSFTYVFKFKGKTRRLTIGSYPKLSLADARSKLSEAQALIYQGIDPVSVKQEATQKMEACPTFAQFSEEYISRWALPNKRSWEKDQSNLNNHVLPLIGEKKISEISRRDIVSVLDPIRERGAEVQGNRVYALIRRIMNFAVERGALETSPATHIKMTKEKSRNRVLTEEEIRHLFKILNNSQIYVSTRLSLELILRTAQRPGEVRQMEKKEIDEKGKLWIKPAAKIKNESDHIVPLTSKMLSIIQVAGSMSNSMYVFPSPRKEGEPLSVYSLAQAMRKVLSKSDMERITPHDLRRSAATAISRLGHNRMTLQKILNHKDSAVTAVYDRYDYLQEKRQALVDWENELERILAGKGKKVIDIKEAMG